MLDQPVPPGAPAPSVPPSPEVAAPRTPRRTAAWLLPLLAVLLVAGAATGVHLWSLDVYSRAEEAFSAASSAAVEMRDELDDAEGDAALTAIAADRLDDAASADGLADAAAREGFADALGGFHGSLDEARVLLRARLPQIVPQPLWTWELFLGADRLAADADAAEEAGATASRAADALQGATQDLDDAARPLLASAIPSAAALEAANVSARAGTVLDVRDAAAEVAAVTEVGPDAARLFERLSHAVDLLRQSNGQELAEKAGPLYDVRLEVEAYARSISGGIVLDFDWADVVAGTGGSEGMGGTATWTTDRGGYSTITLSHSVAQNWPSPDARALVTHEVGHAITSKCYEKFDWADQAANEEWATAWAISMGHTALGNGVYAYGYPSQAMIDLAATCR